MIKVDDQQKQQVVKDYTENKVSMDEMSEQYGLSRYALTNILKEAGVWNPYSSEKSPTTGGMSDAEVEQIVQTHGTLLTREDMMDEFGMTKRALNRACEKLNITPISKAEQTRQYIIDHHKHKTVEDLAGLLDKSEKTIMDIYRELGLKPWVPRRPEDEMHTPGQILGRYKRPLTHQGGMDLFKK